MNAPETFPAMLDFKNHDITPDIERPGVRYEKRPGRSMSGVMSWFLKSSIAGRVTGAFMFSPV